MSDLEKARELEELRYQKLFAELSRGEQEAAQRIDRVMGETGNYQSTARISEIINSMGDAFVAIWTLLKYRLVD